MSSSAEVHGGKAAVFAQSYTNDDAVTTVNKKSDNVEFEVDNPSICSSELNKSKFTKGDTCVPTNEMSEAVESNGYASVSAAASDLQCDSGTKNDKDLCVLEKLNDRKRVVKYFKVPTKSISQNYWINNTEIDTVQYQLSDLFPGYYYSNIHMIDFGMFDPDNKDVMPDIKAVKDINFVNELVGGDSKELTYNGEMKWFGVVVNTDTSDGSGQHWFSIFMDFTSTPCTIEYFNSSGYDVRNPSFKKWFIGLADDVSRAGRKCKYVRVTEIQHQNSTTANCGAYSLYYIWSRLNGTPYSWFGKNKVPDAKMALFRKYVFRSQS